MNPVAVHNLDPSIRQRLFNLAKQKSENFQLVLTHYAIERLLYRMNMSEFHDQFVLKGAMLFYLWDKKLHRPTRDLDLMGMGEISVPRMEMIFKEICQVEVEDDGLSYSKDSVTGIEIREDQEYEGIRIRLTANLANARIPLQIDIGFGDPIIPGPESVEYPTVLDFHPPQLQAYPRDSLVAEKFQIMVRFGIANSRMKDFYDIWFVARKFSFEGQTLSKAIRATFERRQTTLPDSPPLALSPEFLDDSVKKAQWNAFIQRGLLETGIPTLLEVGDFLRDFLMPPTKSMVTGHRFTQFWMPPGPWR